MGWFERQSAREGRDGGGSAVGAVAGPCAEMTAPPPAQPPTASAPPSPPVVHLLYVATDLDSWETDSPEPDLDAICERVGYRRLDPPYYAWLRSRMVDARRAHDRAQVADAAYELLRCRFNAVHEWAVTHLGEARLAEAVRESVVGTYRPPQIEEWCPETAEVPPAPTHRFPAEGEWRFAHPVRAEAVAQVDAIREQALALGWTEAGLYQNRSQFRFPVGEEYGLVCCLGRRDRIGEVTAASVEIVSRTGSRSRVYNRAVPQPWLRRVGEGEGGTISDTPTRVPVSNK